MPARSKVVTCSLANKEGASMPFRMQNSALPQNQSFIHMLEVRDMCCRNGNQRYEQPLFLLPRLLVQACLIERYRRLLRPLVPAMQGNTTFTTQQLPNTTQFSHKKNTPLTRETIQMLMGKETYERKQETNGAGMRERGREERYAEWTAVAEAP